VVIEVAARLGAKVSHRPIRSTAQPAVVFSPSNKPVSVPPPTGATARAAASVVGEPLGAELRIKVTASPVDAAANEALVELLAGRLDCARRRVELIRGHKSRTR